MINNSNNSVEGQNDLEYFWKAQIKSIIGQFLAETTDYREVASLASHIGADYKGRFLIELIQNAEDQSVTSNSINNGSRLIIVRTKNILAIINEGKSFSAKGIKSITSLGLSLKEPEHNLGNKGVGFKAVFEVTDGPEIYSAPEHGSKIWDITATQLRLETDPFSDKKFKERIGALIKDVVNSDQQLELKLKQFLDTDNYIPSVLDELKQAAPFKFPKPIDNNLLSEHLEELGLGKRTLNRAATVIILPLLQSESAISAVENSLDGLIETEYPANVLLFLEKINKLWIIDRVRDKKWIMNRKETSIHKSLPRGAKLLKILTQLSNRSNLTVKSKSAEWWLARRNIGRNGDDPSTANSEEESIEQAVASLEIANWQDVRSAHVAIAFPRPQVNDEQIVQLGSSGKFCIGLPTLVDTGLPAWVDGPFHGRVSRTEIDFDTQDYNGIILNDAKQLFWDVLDELKEDKDIMSRREVLLNLEIGYGAFASKIQEGVTISSREVVLNSSGMSFLKPLQLVLPEADDIKAFFNFVAPVIDVEEYGFIIPDIKLLTRCRNILENLSGETQVTVDYQSYLKRISGRRSLLEDVARQSRNQGREYWEPFLSWITEKFTFTDLKDQKILPIGTNDLAASNARVFFLPLSTDKQSDESDDDLQTIDENVEEIVGDFDRSFLEKLSFLDENCVQVRQIKKRRRLTEIAKKLSPEQGMVLVRRPSRQEIINEVLTPYLASICKDSNKREKAIVILAQIGDWLRDMSLLAKAAVHLDKILVPVLSENNKWTWISSNGVYFGTDWLDPFTNRLLSEAYGNRNNSLLPHWDNFKNVVNIDEGQREIWVERFREIGVKSSSFIEDIPGKNNFYFRAHSYEELTIEVPTQCPIISAEKYWQSYLQYLSKRQVDRKSGHKYYIFNPVWIDGMESEDSRIGVISLILSNPEPYTGIVSSSVARNRHEDVCDFLSFWVYVIRDQQWKVFPTKFGYQKYNKVWRLPESMQGRNFVKDDLISYVKTPYDQSASLLKSLGVFSPAEAPIKRIISELQDLAESLDKLLIEKRRSTETFVLALYEWLQKRCHESPEQIEQLSYIVERPIPLIQDQGITAVDISGDTRILLNDDPSRVSYVIGGDTIGQLPLRSGKPFDKIYKGLCTVLGSDRILRASKAPLNIDFTADIDIDVVSFLDFLIFSSADKDQNIRRELGALIAYGRPQKPMDPQKSDFKDTWKRLQETRLVFGVFNDPRHTGAVFDLRDKAGPTLFVPHIYDYIDVLGSGWKLVGQTYRDVWEAYVGRVRSSNNNTFFQERHITEHDWDELNAIIGSSLEQQIKTLRPVLFTLRRQLTPNLDVDTFLSDLNNYDSTPEKLANWIGVNVDKLINALEESSLHSPDERIINILGLFHIDFSDWQRARKDLRLAPVIFNESEIDFKTTMEKMIAYLQASVAREKKLPRSTLNTYQKLLENLRKTTCPDVVKERPVNTKDSISAVVAALKLKIDGDIVTAEIEFINNRLSAISQNQSFEKTSNKRVSHREINLYQRDEMVMRERLAQGAVDDVLYVAKHLAQLQNEDVDQESIKLDLLLHPWIEGWWSNRFAALRNLRTILKEKSPRTAEKLELVKVYGASYVSWKELWKRFPELGELQQPSKPVTPPKIHTVLGEDIIDSDFEDIIKHGGEGILGKALRAAVDLTFDPSEMTVRTRGVVSAPLKGNRGKRGGGGSGNGSNKANLERIGLLGEAFVFEAFSEVLPEFDSACWVSENRQKYGLTGRGDDSLGYDFKYTDTQGTLTGRDLKHCYIEVKATSSETDIPFPMTTNEWHVATECHSGKLDALYIIIRVVDVEAKPKIVDIILNPYGLWLDRKLAYASRDFIIYNAPLES